MYINVRVVRFFIAVVVVLVAVIFFFSFVEVRFFTAIMLYLFQCRGFEGINKQSEIKSRRCARVRVCVSKREIEGEEMYKNEDYFYLCTCTHRKKALYDFGGTRSIQIRNVVYIGS